MLHNYLEKKSKTYLDTELWVCISFAEDPTVRKAKLKI